MSGRTVRSVSPPVRDGGSTLVEMLISMVVIGVIFSALLSVVATFLRNDAAASTRIDESRDLQQMSVYVSSDVSSAFLTELVVDSTTGDAYRDANDPATPVGCAGYSVPAGGSGANVLSLKWSETFGGTTKQYRVDYRTETVAGATLLVRVSCEGVSVGSATTRIVGRQLRTTSPAAVTLNGPRVVITLTEKTGRTLTLTATSQNPNAQLETTTDYE